VVVPLGDEGALRNRTWEEDNRRTVARLSNGRLGYAHIPDTTVGGWTNFARYYYSQIDKPGMVIDERFNHGGQVDDYMVNTMTEPLASMWMSRYGKDFASPAWANFGPKVLLINEMAGSGGDYFPWHFRHGHAGPIIGKRTWGGLVGILVFPVLVDGGYVTAPNIAFYNPNGTWDVENHGVDPDFEVDLDPRLWREGRDTQLEKGVEVAMHLLETQKPPTVKRPAFKDKSTVQGAEGRP
jgi:tricorn protease